MGFHTAAQEPAGEVAMVPAVVVLLAALRRSRSEVLVQWILSGSLRPYSAVAVEECEAR